MIKGVSELVDVTETNPVPVEASTNAGVVAVPPKGVTVTDRSEVSLFLKVTGCSCLGEAVMPNLSNMLRIIDSRASWLITEGLDVTETEMYLFAPGLEAARVGVVWSFTGGERVTVEVAKD